MLFQIKFILLIIICIKRCSSFEPISTAIGALSVAAGFAGTYFGYQGKIGKLVCGTNVYECCGDSHIPVNISALRNDFKTHLFGQHIVIEQIISALESHYKNIETSKKPLVISLHGTPGTGKNYVSEFIIKNIYKNGLKSKFIKQYLGRIDFRLESEINEYKKQIVNDIETLTKKCPRSLFVFDEIDKMPPGIYDSIATYFDHHHSIKDINFRQAVFIFISNVAGVEIGNTLLNLMSKEGLTREETRLYHFENLLERGAFNVVGGFQNSEAIKSSLIDHFIPFLPLEKRHVELCIAKEFQRVGHMPTKEDIAEIITYLTYDKKHGQFISSGCKRISKKVEAYAELKKK